MSDALFWLRRRKGGRNGVTYLSWHSYKTNENRLRWQKRFRARGQQALLYPEETGRFGAL